jgi:putative ABC transport system substrate-binding protein
MQFDHLRRRELITLLGASTAAWPLVARAQQPAMPVVGVLGATTAEGYSAQVAAFRQGLHEAGYREGQNVAVEYRWADNEYDRLPALAADLISRRVAVIATFGGNPATFAAKAANASIPIIFHGSLDPVGAGFVDSLNRPGGNMTGVVTLNVEVAAKRLELLHELVPAAATFGLLLNPNNPIVADTQSKDVQAAARRLGHELAILYAGSERDFDTVFSGLAGRVGGLVIGTDGFFVSKSEELGELTLRHSLPAISVYRGFVTAGGLMSYGESSNADSYRISGVYVGRILKGEKVADLPVQQVTKIELILNLKSAKTLGLTIPLPLLGRADEVIE